MQCGTSYRTRTLSQRSSTKYEALSPPESAITGDSTVKLRYLSAVIEESMRIFAPISEGLPRKSPGAVIDGHYIPPGVYLSAQIWHIHRNPEIAPNPDKFDAEMARLGINLAYLEMRITLAKMVYRYDWAFPDEYLESGAD